MGPGGSSGSIEELLDRAIVVVVLLIDGTTAGPICTSELASLSFKVCSCCFTSSETVAISVHSSTHIGTSTS